MEGIVLNGTMKDICAELQVDLRLFGNVSILEYQEIRANIAKYGVSAVKYYKQKAENERLAQLNTAIAKQFGISVDEFKIQLGGGTNGTI